MRAILQSYAGVQGCSPHISGLYRNFTKYIHNSEHAVHRKLGLEPLPDDYVVEVVVSDDSEFGCIPMYEPTGMANQVGPYVNKIWLSACALSNNYYGYTTVQKVITHELVHLQTKLRGGQTYEQSPLWLKEGIALWVADQTHIRDFRKVPRDLRNHRWSEYLSYITRFNDYRSKVGIDVILAQLGIV